MEIIDTHCHLDVEAFDPDREAVLARCHDAGISTIVVPGIAAAGWDKLIALCSERNDLYPALGLHPIYINDHLPDHIGKLKALVAQYHPVAIGEIGLDYYIETLDRTRQQSFLEQQLQLAGDVNLPVILHVRKSHDQMIKTLKRFTVPGGIVHAFNGSLPQAQQYMDMGFKLGFGGTLTYEGSKKIRRLARELPLEAIVLETDAPDMVVSAHRGQRNSPEYVLDCARALAKIRDCALEDIALQTSHNARAILNLHQVPFTP
jgi:TatD DNase family protein